MRGTARYWATRIRGPIVPVGVVAVLTAFVLDLGWLVTIGTAMIILGLVLLFVSTEQPDHPPVTVHPPVRGRWLAINSPADKVPSHGTRELGQAYAIDLVHVPDPQVEWRGTHRWPPARRPHRFPGFGEPVYAPADGTVVRASGWQRDHWSRNSPWGVAYLLVEMIIRSVLSGFGAHFVMGNHVIIQCGDGVYAALAHLKRGSIRVRRGQRVRAGDLLAECGNSGNTSEPHLHFQLMDHHQPMTAAGVPFEFDHYLVDGQPRTGVPAGTQAFTVPALA